MAFTEFYCNPSTGNNLNAGSSESTILVNVRDMNWDGTSVFTVSAGTDLSALVTALAAAGGGSIFASVFDSSGADPAVAVYVARVTAADNTAHTVTLDTTSKCGTAPSSDADERGLIVGGPWLGPNAAVGHPLSFVTNVLVNSDGDTPRINLKNNATYAVTSGVTTANNGPIRYQGYTDTVADGGKFTLSGGTSVTVTLLASSGTELTWADLIVTGAPTSGTAALWTLGDNNIVIQGVVSGSRRAGISCGTSAGVRLIEVEAYGNDTSNTASVSGIQTTTGAVSLNRCIIHGNAGSNAIGLLGTSGTLHLTRCIIESNGSDGLQSAGAVYIVGCDFYNNGGDGIDLNSSATARSMLIESCNFVKNGGYGINGSGAAARIGSVINCGFGAGTQANTSGTTTGLKSMVESGSVTYAADVTPWVDPADGDFRINLAAAKGTGRGAFTQTQAGYGAPNPTVAYPDIGAGQGTSVQSGGGGGFPVLGGSVVR
jgi:hypothetical protein